MTGPTTGFFATFATLAFLLASCDVSPAGMDLTDRTRRAQDGLNARAEAVLPLPTAGRLPAANTVQTASLQPKPEPVVDDLPPRRTYKHKSKRVHHGRTKVVYVHRPVFRPFGFRFGRRW